MNKKILIIGFVWPEPKSSAAGSRMMQLIDLFLDYGFSITFASTALNLEFSEDLTKKGVQRELVAINCSTFDYFIADLNPTVVLFDRFMVEEQFGWRVSEHCPHAMKILDTEDLHCLRQSRQDSIKNKTDFDPNELLISDYAKREIASIYRCDLSLFVSEFEIELLKNIFKIPEYLFYYLPLFAERLEVLASFENRNDFIFIGNFLHEPNWDAVKYLKERIWPIINNKLPDAKMLIYGAYATQKVVELNKPKEKFYIKGRVEDAVAVVKNAKVVLAPIRFGAGIKGKLLEAMQCGTPSVTTSVGAEAMNGDLVWNGFIENEPNEIANKAVKLYTDAKLWKLAQENGFEILEKRYLKSLFEKHFMDMISNLQVNLKDHRKKNFIGAMLQHSFNASTKYMSKWIEEKNKKL